MRKASRVYPLIIVLLLAGASCGNPGGRTEITETYSAPVQPVAPSSITPKQAGASVETSAPNLQWDMPSGWTSVPATAMRLANFRVGPAQDTECYASVLKGAAGGVGLNMERWRGQMDVEGPPLDEAAIAALPKITVLGQSASLLEARGTYRGMEGQSHGDYMLLGTVAQREGYSVFVKMIGPMATVQSQREAFIAFCGSLR